MLQAFARLQSLLAAQLKSSHGDMHNMSVEDWLEYEARDEEIAELFKTLHPPENGKSKKLM